MKIVPNLICTKCSWAVLHSILLLAWCIFDGNNSVVPCTMQHYCCGCNFLLSALLCTRTFSSEWFSPWAPAISANGFRSIAFSRRSPATKLPVLRRLCSATQWITSNLVQWAQRKLTGRQTTHIHRVELVSISNICEWAWDVNLRPMAKANCYTGLSNATPNRSAAHHSHNLQFLYFNEHKGIICGRCHMYSLLCSVHKHTFTHSHVPNGPGNSGGASKFLN